MALRRLIFTANWGKADASKSRVIRILQTTRSYTTGLASPSSRSGSAKSDPPTRRGGATKNVNNPSDATPTTNAKTGRYVLEETATNPPAERAPTLLPAQTQTLRSPA